MFESLEKLKFEIPANANFRSAPAHNDQLNRRRNKRRSGGGGKRRSLIVRPTVSSGQSGRYLGSVSVYPPGPSNKTRAKIGWFVDVKAFRTHPGEWSFVIDSVPKFTNNVKVSSNCERTFFEDRCAYFVFRSLFVSPFFLPFNI